MLHHRFAVCVHTLGFLIYPAYLRLSLLARIIYFHSTLYSFFFCTVFDDVGRPYAHCSDLQRAEQSREIRLVRNEFRTLLRSHPLRTSFRITSLER